MYNIKPTSKFQKDLKRVYRRGYDISLLSEIIKKRLLEKTSLQKTKIMPLLEIILAAVSVTLLRIGC